MLIASMKRIIIVYNPRSSRFKDVEREVLVEARGLKGYAVGKYEVKATNLEDNVKSLARIIQDDDLVVAAGGDATGVIVANAVMLSSKEALVSALPFGNFNDFSRTLGLPNFRDVLSGKLATYWPLEILVDGKHFRYATCYVSMGMTAESVKIFDDKKIRKKLQKGHKSSWRSYFYLANWYFKHRHKKKFIPEFLLNGVAVRRGTSDYFAMNGASMSRVMKTRPHYKKSKMFIRFVGRLVSFPKLCDFMAKSMFSKVPGRVVDGDTILFLKPATVELQAEGEYKTFENVSKIEIRKAKTPLKVVMKKHK